MINTKEAINFLGLTSLNYKGLSLNGYLTTEKHGNR